MGNVWSAVALDLPKVASFTLTTIGRSQGDHRGRLRPFTHALICLAILESGLNRRDSRIAIVGVGAVCGFPNEVGKAVLLTFPRSGQ